MKMWMVGLPSNFGGADTERGHTALLWRRAGVEVSCLYFTECSCGTAPQVPSKDNPWIEKMVEAGVTIVQGTPGRLRDVDGLAGSVLSSFCHPHLAHNWRELHNLGCRLIWSPCMCDIQLWEVPAFRDRPPEVLHCQSGFQQERLGLQYLDWGVRDIRQIHGAFDPLPFRPLAHEPGQPFVIGRLARPSRTKWTPYLWNILGAVRSKGVDARALCQGWSEDLDRHVGEHPEWATCLPAGTLTPEDFLGRCHAMVCPNWGVQENWPRIGLEAMSAGIPLVVDKAGGWVEQLGDSGILCPTLGDYVQPLVHLATDSAYRDRVITAGLERGAVLWEPEAITQQWMQVFSDLV